ncbi:MAG: CapA family protein [Candidatus Limnocylindrales bacterium]
MPPIDHVRRRLGALALLVGALVLPAAGGVASLSRQGGDVLSAPTGPTISVAIGGDVMLGEDINTAIARMGADAPLSGVPDLRGADLAIVNLEGVVAPGADAIDTGRVGDYFFLGRPESLAVLAASGIDVVATANNHARDYGTGTLAAQNRLLAQMRLAHPGTGMTLTEACAPAFLEVGEMRVALLAVDATTPSSSAGDGRIGTCHLSPTDITGWPNAFRKAIEDARARADVVLAMPHFRASFSPEPHAEDRRVARELIDLGADAVLGVGAHVLQGIEVHAERPILHNMGTLLFNFPDPDEAAIFLLDVSASGITAVRTVPLVTERAWTRPADPAESARILAEMDARSRVFGTPLSGGLLTMTPPPRDPPRLRPEILATLDPGPGPVPLDEPPAACLATSVPDSARLDPIDLGPLTLVGARTERAQMDGPALIWLETFWRTSSRPTSDLVFAAQASPERGMSWAGRHEPCDWAWPTSRWEPGVIYRDRYPLRPPGDVQRLAGVPALLTMTGYGNLGISVDVVDEGRLVATSPVVRTVVLDPPVMTRIGIVALVLGSAVVAALAGRHRRGALRGG